MNETFSTEDFEIVCKYIKCLLDEEREVRIAVDPEGVYMVDHCDPTYSSETFMAFNEETQVLEGNKIYWSSMDDEDDVE